MMDVKHRTVRQLVVLLVVSALTESQFAFGSSKRNSLLPREFHIRKNAPVMRVPVRVTRPPALHRAVVVTCHADAMEVVVHADLFDTGVFIEARHLHLGSKACTAFESGEAEVTIHAYLMDCGTKLSSTTETLIYSNVLIYSPEPSPDGRLRLDGATIPVECHYKKRYSVDGFPMRPTWIPFAATATAEDQIDFKLTLRTDDWQFERESRAYYLGDPIHLEASVVMSDHMPLRIYVDHCVATATPDADATLRYDVIENHGCLADAYLTRSGSRFLPRAQEDKLRFLLEAFKFYQDSTNQIYITCHVKAVPAMLAVSSKNRACSFIHDRWQSVDGNDQACGNCGEPKPTDSPAGNVHAPTWPPRATGGDAVRTELKQTPANHFRLPPGSHPSHNGMRGKRGANSGAEWSKTTSLGPFVVLPGNAPAKRAVSAASLPTEAPHESSNATTEFRPTGERDHSTAPPSNPAH